MFFDSWPASWPTIIGNLAYTFRFQPSEIWKMSPRELLFWNGQAERIAAELKDEAPKTPGQ